MCLSSLLYGCDSLNLDDNDIKCLDKFQSSSVKSMLCINKRSHHSKLLQAANDSPVCELLKDKILSLYYRSFKVSSPLKDLIIYFISQYVKYGIITNGTLVSKINNISAAFSFRYQVHIYIYE